VNVYVFLLNPF